MTKDNIQTNETAPEILSDTSATGRNRPWRKQKVGSQAVAASMYRLWNKHPRKWDFLKRRADRMWRCSDYLVFSDNADKETGEVTHKLHAAEFCRDRMCAMCQWRKSLVLFAQVSDIMNKIDAEHSGEFVPIFLTLTMKNVATNELGQGITDILKAWSRMMNKSRKRKPYFVTRGWFRALEITYNAQTKEWHPHIHAVLLVDADYFENPNKYIEHSAWIAEWKWALQVDYDPNVDVRTFKGERSKAVAEVSKYSVKPGEWLDKNDNDGTDERVFILATELKGRRLTAFGGLMLQVRKELKQEDVENADLVHTDEDATMRGEIVIALERYEWQIGISNYVKVKREVVKNGCAATPEFEKLE